MELVIENGECVVNEIGEVMVKDVRTGARMYVTLVNSETSNSNNTAETEEEAPQEPLGIRNIEDIDVATPTTSSAPRLQKDEEVVVSKNWTDEMTKLMLSIYLQIFTSKDPNIKCKPKKKKWELVASEMAKFNHVFSKEQVRNRFVTLERAFKKVIDHNKKTGRNRKELSVSSEVKKLLENIFGGRENVHLPYTLNDDDAGNDKIINDKLHMEARASALNIELTDDDPFGLQEEAVVDDPTPAATPTSDGSTRKRRKATLVEEISELRKERKEHNDKRLEAMKDKNNQIAEYINETKRSNDLLQQHNDLLKAILQKL